MKAGIGIWCSLATLLCSAWCAAGVTGDIYIDVKVFLPLDPAILPATYLEDANNSLATAAGVPISDLTQAVLDSNPPSYSAHIITTNVTTRTVMSVLDAHIKSKGFSLAGVDIKSAELNAIGVVLNECVENPCNDQLCHDPNDLVTGDFECSCLYGNGKAVGSPAAACGEPPHLEITLLLPSDKFLQGLGDAVREKVASVLQIAESQITSVSLEAVPYPAAVASINASAPYLPKFQSMLQDAVNSDPGMLVAGVKVLGIESKIVAAGVHNECEEAPCGPGQICTDPSLTDSGDFICACPAKDGTTYPMVGKPTSSCDQPLEDISDLANMLEGIALCNGHTVLPATHNSILYATHCNAPLEDPPLALHPTRLKVGGSMLAGCVVSNTSLLVGALVIQHLLILILSFYTKGAMDLKDIHALVGYPYIPLRVFITLLPGALFCGIGLLDSVDGTWGMVLGGLTLFFWLLCLGGMVFKDFATLVTLSIGQKKWDGAGWVRVDQFKKRHVAMIVIITVVLSTNMSHRFGGGGACAGPRLFVSMGLFLYTAVIALTRPWHVKAHNIFAFFAYIVQSLAWTLMGFGLYNAEGHRDHELVNGSVYLRFIGACSLMLWMLVSLVYRVGGADEGKWYDPREAVLQAWEAPHLQKAIVISRDLVWVALACAVAVYWMAVFGALLIYFIHMALVFKNAPLPTPTKSGSHVENHGLAEEDLNGGLSEKLLVEEEDVNGVSGYSPPTVGVEEEMGETATTPAHKTVDMEDESPAQYPVCKAFCFFLNSGYSSSVLVIIGKCV